MADQVKINPLGQIADNVVEQLQSSGSQAAKSLANEPAKILEQILGGQSVGSSQNEGQHTEQNPGAAAAQAQQQAQDDLIAQKTAEAQERDAKLYQLHQQRLREEVEYHEKRKHEEEQKKAAKDQEEQQQKQIVQLKKERAAEEAWQREVKAVQGSHEGQQSKF